MIKIMSKGFAPIFLVIAVVILGLATIFGLKAVEIYKQKTHQASNQVLNSSGACSSPFKLSYSPLKLEDLEFITPLGRTQDSHVTPTDHQYWSPKGVEYTNDYTTGEPIYDIYSPADGTITSLERHTFIPSDRNSNLKIDDWRIIINHDCGVSSIFIHIDKLTDEIMGKICSNHGTQNGTTSYQANIPVKAGQLIGHLRKRSFDFSVHDQNVILKGFVNPKRYDNEFWKIHTVDPFDYFEPQIAQALKAKTPRSVPPTGGKIDYDIEGRLIGNWFKKGTSYQPQFEGRFWDPQLAISYNHFDPKFVILTTGDYQGKSATFSLKGNSLDPKDVGVGQLVKYELVNFDYIDDQGRIWDNKTYPKTLTLRQQSNVQATVLFKLEDASSLKVEFFPGKSSSEVTDFTSNAKVYER